MTQTQPFKHQVSTWAVPLHPSTPCISTHAHVHFYMRARTHTQLTHTPEQPRIKWVQITQANSWLKLQTLRLVGTMPGHSNFISTNKLISLL